METKQLTLWSQKSENCPFEEFTEEEDENCFSLGLFKNGYEVIGEDHPDFARWIADIGNIGFNDIVAKNIPELDLPSFIPVVARGSGKILNNIVPPALVGVSLGNVVDEKTLEVSSEIRKRFGIDQKSKVVLLCFGKDDLIEKIWTERRTVFPKIASLGFDLITGINYSIWFDHPHAERLINPKRGLITFREFQELGIPAIPHIYWSGNKDILRWCDWLYLNPCVCIVAIDTQTERSGKDWERTITGLRFLVSNLNREIHFLITGPSTPSRIRQIKSIVPKLSIANGYCARQAASGFVISDTGNKLVTHYSNMERNTIMAKNLDFYKNMVETKGYEEKRMSTLIDKTKDQSKTNSLLLSIVTNPPTSAKLMSTGFAKIIEPSP